MSALQHGPVETVSLSQIMSIMDDQKWRRIVPVGYPSNSLSNNYKKTGRELVQFNIRGIARLPHSSGVVWIVYWQLGDRDTNPCDQSIGWLSEFVRDTMSSLFSLSLCMDVRFHQPRTSSWSLSILRHHVSLAFYRLSTR